MNGIIIAIVNMIGVGGGGVVPPPSTGDMIAENGIDFIIAEDGTQIISES